MIALIPCKFPLHYESQTCSWTADDELFEMEDSGDEDLVGEQEESEESLRDHVRKMKAKKESTEADEGGIEIDSDEDYDEDEAALQHALALSLAKTSEAEGEFYIL